MENPHLHRHPRRGYTGRGYSGHAEHCSACTLRSKCIRGKKTKVRNITIIDHSETYIKKMIERFDTDRGRHYYSRRMGTAEPVFANTRRNLGLDWFSLRGRVKVDTQWKLFCGPGHGPFINIGKLTVYGRPRPNVASPVR